MILEENKNIINTECVSYLKNENMMRRMEMASAWGKTKQSIKLTSNRLCYFCVCEHAGNYTLSIFVSCCIPSAFKPG